MVNIRLSGGAMSKEALSVELYSPTASLKFNQIASVTAVCGNGHFVVLPGHADLVAHIVPSVLKVGAEYAFVVSSAVLEVSGGLRCCLVAGEFISVSELEESWANAKIMEAEGILGKCSSDSIFAIRARYDIAYAREILGLIKRKGA